MKVPQLTNEGKMCAVRTFMLPSARGKGRGLQGAQEISKTWVRGNRVCSKAKYAASSGFWADLQSTSR
jgi:hypothetical protein